MRALTAKDILGADDLKSERVEVPEWDGYLFVRVMTGDERDKWELYIQSREIESMDGVRALFVSYTAVDESGKRLFTDDQVKELGNKSASALDRVFQAARILNKLSDADVEATVKN